MWRWARWVFLGFVIVAAIALSWSAWVEHKEAARLIAYDRHIETLRTTYPPGTRRGDIEKKFTSQLGSETDPDIYALIGSDPSAEWYCSGWNTYAHFRFNRAEDRASERLVTIERFTWGRDCL